MTLRDKLVATLAQQYDQYGFNRQDAADAILATVRADKTSAATVDRVFANITSRGMPVDTKSFILEVLIAAMGTDHDA